MRSPCLFIPMGLAALTALAALSPAQALPIEEITVTAQGRPEPLAATPSSITAFTGPGIEARRLITLEDLGAAVPGMFVINDQDPGTNIITLRGVSTDRLQAPSVAFIVDGVPLADTELFTARLHDIAQIEVLKGPQGALYGRNAAGGVIDITTAAPPDALSGGARVELGEGETRALRAHLGGPLGPRARARLSAFSHDSGGFITNRTLGRKVDGLQSRGLRARLEAHPAPRLELGAIFSFLDEEGGAAFISSNDVVGEFGGRLDGAALTDPIGDFPGRARRLWRHGALTASWTGEAGTLSLMGARDSYEKDFIEELDFRPDTPITLGGVPLFPDGIQPIRQPVNLGVTTAELRWTSADPARWRWTAGVFLQDSERIRIDDFGPLLFGAEAPRFVLDSTQLGIFGQLALDISEHLELRFALRHDRDDRREQVRGAATGTLFRSQAEIFGATQPKLTLGWRPDATTTIFASYAEGFKSGGFNPIPGPFAAFEEEVPAEITRALELGARAGWMDGRLRAGASLFASRISAYQSYNFIDGQSVILSADRVDVLGAEASLAWRPLPALTLSAAGNLTDAEIVDFTVPDPFGSPVPRDFSGNQVPNSPRWAVTASAAWKAEPRPGTQLDLRLDYAHTGEVFYQPDNVLFSPAFGILEARLALSHGRWEAAFWADNLTDTRRAISGFSQTLIPLLADLGPGGPFDSFTLNKPRRFGVSLAVRFGSGSRSR